MLGKPGWNEEYAELKELLTESEYKAARESVLNAHYTQPVIIESMYKALEQMGFQSGNVLEPFNGDWKLLWSYAGTHAWFKIIRSRIR